MHTLDIYNMYKMCLVSIVKCGFNEGLGGPDTYPHHVKYNSGPLHANQGIYTIRLKYFRRNAERVNTIQNT